MAVEFTNLTLCSSVKDGQLLVQFCSFRVSGNSIEELLSLLLRRRTFAELRGLFASFLELFRPHAFQRRINPEQNARSRRLIAGGRRGDGGAVKIAGLKF